MAVWRRHDILQPLEWYADGVPMVCFCRRFFAPGRFLPRSPYYADDSGEKVIFRLFSAKHIQGLAQSLAADIASRYPAEIANSPEPMVSQRRRSEILENVFSQARQFSLENQLGILARIRLDSALKWRLKEMGYDEIFIDMATEYLRMSIAREPK